MEAMTQMGKSVKSVGSAVVQLATRQAALERAAAPAASVAPSTGDSAPVSLNLHTRF